MNVCVCVRKLMCVSVKLGLGELLGGVVGWKMQQVYFEVVVVAVVVGRDNNNKRRNRP